MVREKRECMTIIPEVSVSEMICICPVALGTQGITEQMAPKEAIEKIGNLLISTTKHGCQDTSLLACYKLFDKYLDKHGILRPVFLTSDGNSSRFDFEILQFFSEKKSVLLSRHQTQQV